VPGNDATCRVPGPHRGPKVNVTIDSAGAVPAITLA